MKVTWKPRAGDTEGAAAVLGDDSLGFRAAGTKFVLVAEPEGISFQAQAAAYPRAEQVETFARKNQQTAYRVIIDYQFRTVGERTRFQHRVAQGLVREGILEIQHDNGGMDAMEAVLLGIQKVGSNGVALVLQFSFLGGAFTPGPASNLAPVPTV